MSEPATRRVVAGLLAAGAVLLGAVASLVWIGTLPVEHEVRVRFVGILGSLAGIDALGAASLAFLGRQ